jgi:hypothetical protein
MAVSEVINEIFEIIAKGIGLVAKLVTGLINLISSNKTKNLPDK